MLQKSLSDAFRSKLRADSRLDVIIHLDVSDMVLIYHAVDHLVDMGDNCRIAEVELVSAPVIHALSMTDEKPIVRRILCLFAVDSHNLKLQPYARDHALFADVIGDFLNAIWKTLPGFLPFTDTVPPLARCIPPGIDDIIFAAAFCRRIDKRKLLLCCRITKQAVHIIVENYRQILVILIRSADHAAVSGQLPKRLFKAVLRYADCNRHRLKGFPRRKILKPVRLHLRRSADTDVKMRILITDLIVP